MLHSNMACRYSRWSALVQTRLLQLIRYRIASTARVAVRMQRRRISAVRKNLNQPRFATPHHTFPCHITLLALAT